MRRAGFAVWNRPPQGVHKDAEGVYRVNPTEPGCCRICNHPVYTVGVMTSGLCAVVDCAELSWHKHCGHLHSACTTAGCWPAATDDPAPAGAPATDYYNESSDLADTEESTE